MVIDFLKYYLKATNAHGIHSPFVYELYTKVYKDFSKNQDFLSIETRRKELRKDNRIIQIEDFGAGSKVNSSTNRTVADISKKSLKSIFWSQFFYRIIKHYNYRNILELGTSLGVTTQYLAKASPEGKIYTLEGCSNTLNIAKEGFSELPAIIPIQGDIDKTLPELLSETDPLDFVLFDANHRYEPTLRYFEECLKHCHDDSVFVFDDIYWSKEMKAAWIEIQSDQRVRLSIDFFQIGLVFFKKGVEKQHFILK